MLMVRIISFLKKYILLISLVLTLGLVASVYHHVEFFSSDYSCSTVGLNRGFPIGFLKTSSSTNSYGDNCIPVIQYHGINILYLLIDLVSIFIINYLILRLIIWWTSRPAFKKSKHVYIKSLILGAFAGIIEIFIEPKPLFIWFIYPLIAFLLTTLISLIFLIIRSNKKK